MARGDYIPIAEARLLVHISRPVALNMVPLCLPPLRRCAQPVALGLRLAQTPPRRGRQLVLLSSSCFSAMRS